MCERGNGGLGCARWVRGRDCDKWGAVRLLPFSWNGKWGQTFPIFSTIFPRLFVIGRCLPPERKMSTHTGPFMQYNKGKRAMGNRAIRGARGIEDCGLGDIRVRPESSAALDLR